LIDKGVKRKMKFLLSWENLGDIKEGRPTFGTESPVLMYRLLQFSLRDVIERSGEGEGGRYLYRAGELVGGLIYEKFLSEIRELDELLKKLADLLYEQKICILRVEKSDPEKGEFVFVASEDLDCSGVPEVGWPICQFDEGIVAGILSSFTGKRVVVKEVDCWATGERFCRLEVKVE
jgi:hypothetical protein